MSTLDDVLAGMNGGGDGWGPPAADSSSAPVWATYASKKKKKGGGLFGGNLIQDFFNTVSTPLHAVTSALTEGTQGIGQLMGHDYGQNVQYIVNPDGSHTLVDEQGNPLTGDALKEAQANKGFSFHDLWNQTFNPEDAVDFGDYVSGAPEKGINAALFKGGKNKGPSILPWDAPGPVRFVASLAGDVGLDPLSFVGPAGEVHGAASAAGHISEVAGQQIAKELLPETGGKLTGEMIQQILKGEKAIDDVVKVTPETAMKVAEIRTAAEEAAHAVRRGGASALTAEQLDRFGTFTNDLGKTRQLEKGLQLDFGRLGHIRLTQGESAVSQLSVIRHKAQMQLGDLLLGGEGKARALGKLRGDAELRAISRSGPMRRTEEGGMSLLDATTFRRLRATTRNIAETAAKDAQKLTTEAIKGYTDDEIEAARTIINTGGETAAAATPRERELAQKLSAVQEKHGRTLVDAGVLSEDNLIKAGNYYPSPITRDALDAMRAAGLHPAEGEGVFNNARAFIEGQRKLWDPTTGKGGIGLDGEGTRRIPFTAKTRLEAEHKAGKILAEELEAAAKVEGKAGKAARDFLADHPEIVKALKDGEYPLFQQGREALLAQTRAMGKRIAMARAGRKLFEQGYGMVHPGFVKGFVDYGPTAEEVQRMLRLGEASSVKAADRDVLSRLINQRADTLAGREADRVAMEEGRLPLGPAGRETPPGGPRTAENFLGSEASNEARLAAESNAYAAGDTGIPQQLPLGPVDQGGRDAIERAARRAEAAGAVRRVDTPEAEGGVFEQVTRQKQANIEAIQQVEPPKPAGTVRLYNRDGTNWWNDGLKGEAVAGGPEGLDYIDVTPAELQELTDASVATAADHGIAIDERLDPTGRLTELMQRRKPVAGEQGPSQSAIEQAMASLDAYANRGAPPVPEGDTVDFVRMENVPGETQAEGLDRMRQYMNAEGQREGEAATLQGLDFQNAGPEAEGLGAGQTYTESAPLRPGQAVARESTPLGRAVEDVAAKTEAVGRVNALNDEFGGHGWHVEGEMPDQAHRIVVTGGRDVEHPGATRLLIQRLKELYGNDIVIVHGDARGVDRTFARIAQEEGVAVEAHPADWNQFGKSAGFRRNAEMANSGVDLAVVFPGGKGTAHMAGTVRKAGIPTIELGPGVRAATEAATPAEKALVAAHEGLTTAQVVENMNRYEALFDDARAYLAERAKSSRPMTTPNTAAHEAELDKIIEGLGLRTDMTFASEPLDALEAGPGMVRPSGAGGKAVPSEAQRIMAKERAIKNAISEFERQPDVVAAKLRARAEGKLAEDAQRAKAGAELPDTTKVPERRVKWTDDERTAHTESYKAVQELSPQRDAARAEVDKALDDLAAAKADPRPTRLNDQAILEENLRKVQDDRDALQEAYDELHGMQAQEAAKTAEQQAYERPVGGVGDIDKTAYTAEEASYSGEGTTGTDMGRDPNANPLQRWADRNRYPEPEGELTGAERADYEARMRAWEEAHNMPPADTGETATWWGDKRYYDKYGSYTGPMTTDRMANAEIERRLAEMDNEVEFLKRMRDLRLNRSSDTPVTTEDMARIRLEMAQNKFAKLNEEVETAKRGVRPKGSDQYHDAPSGKMVDQPTRVDHPTLGEVKSPYAQAVDDMGEAIDKANAKAVEQHLEGRERYVHGDRPFRSRDTGETLNEGTLAGAAKSTRKVGKRITSEGRVVDQVDADVVKARAAKIREDWKAFGETAGDHSQAAEAWRNYKGKLDKAIPQTVGRDMVAKAAAQVDTVGLLAQSESHVASMADDLASDAALVKGADPSVIPPQVQENVAARAQEAQELVTVSQQAKAAGESARGEIARMRLAAAHLANDSEFYRRNAADWLNQWNSITTERGLHSAIDSLLVQGQIDWLKYSSLQRGILTPKAATDALMMAQRLATPEGSNRLAQSWRRALHWMRVWQITSPGFHVRNLFGGVFNNALAGADAESYVRFAKLWRKASSGAKLTDEEFARWSQITKAISPGQIGSEALGNPASRLMGEAAVSKTPWGQFTTHGVLPRVSENAGANVEFFLRGTLMDDVMMKGGSLDDAVEAVNKFHFDYHDSSVTEQWLKANAIPFLTWTRHNVPLQLEMMLENPKVYARFAHFKREMESQSTADKVVPGYFADINAVRLPWSQGGGHNYYIPDLPFRDVGLVTEPIQQLVGGQGDFGQRALAALGEPISSTTPLISGPVEWMLGKQFFKGIPLREDRGIKMRDLHIPEWLAAPLRLTPIVKKGSNGQSYITERDFYIIEKMLPILGRARRLGGSGESRQQNKLMSHLISFFAGTQIRTNTEEDQKIANYLSTLETKRKTTINNGLEG